MSNMFTKEQIINILKDSKDTLSLHLKYVLGYKAAAVLLGIRTSTEWVDVFVSAKTYQDLHLKEHMPYSLDWIGEYIPYNDFIRVRVLSKKDFDKTVNDFELPVIHPSKLLEDYGKLITREDSPNCDKVLHRDIKTYINRYW